MSQLQDLSDEDITLLPIDRLGLVVLEHLVETNEWNSHNFLNSANIARRSKPTQFQLAEGVNWLINHGLVARSKPGPGTADSIFVTRLGQQAMAEGIDVVRAAQRVDLDLHPRLRGANSQFLLGEFELAAFAALREVEIRVRALTNADESLIGVNLMKVAFNPDSGLLADSSLERGEMVGVMELFAGAIGTFKSPSSHRQIDYEDPTEASEVVLLADLLMRLLDRYEGVEG